MNNFNNTLNITYMQQIKKYNVIILGNRIREKREALGVTINQIVNLKGGLSVATWSRIENGVYSNIDFSTLIVISNALGCTIDFLLKDLNFDYRVIE